VHEGGEQQRARLALEEQLTGQPATAAHTEERDFRGDMPDFPAEHTVIRTGRTEL
jgi:hypothetical protein